MNEKQKFQIYCMYCRMLLVDMDTIPISPEYIVHISVDFRTVKMCTCPYPCFDIVIFRQKNIIESGGQLMLK